MQQAEYREADEPSLGARSRPSGIPSPADDQALHGIAVVGTDGIVRFCTSEAARAFGGTVADFVGRSVGVLVPALKLRRGTPGYNVAYALFWFPHEQWRTVEALACDGRVFPLDVSVSVARIDGHHQLLLSIRQPSFGAESGAAGSLSAARHAPPANDLHSPLAAVRPFPGATTAGIANSASCAR